MKINKIIILSTFILGSIAFLTSCSKDDGAIKKRIGIEDVPAISVNFATGPNNVFSSQIALASAPTFEGKFVASAFFPGTPLPTKIDISVRKNTMTTITGVATNTNVKVFKTNITTFPSTFSVTAAELATLFGAPIATNQAYDFGVDIYVGDKKYEAFPAGVFGAGSGISGMSTIGFGEYVRYYFK